MEENDKPETRIVSVKDIYENFEINEANMIKDKEGIWYLWDSEKKVYLPDEEVEIIKISNTEVYIRKKIKEIEKEIKGLTHKQWKNLEKTCRHMDELREAVGE